jgi:two-component system sensor kinase FixL
MLKAKEIMNGNLVPTSEVARAPRPKSPARQRPTPSKAQPGTPAPAETEPTLEQNISHYRVLLGKVSDVLFQITKDGFIRSAHFSEHHEYALPEGGFTGKSIRELLPPQLAQQAMFYLEKTVRTGQLNTFTGQILLFGKPRDFQASLLACGPGEVLAAVRDITDRKYLEKEIIEISHREQTRIGQDLHDGLGQHLTGITFLTRALENKLSGLRLPEAKEAAEIGRLVLEALTQTRTLARGLFPIELESKGLVSALKELAASVAKSAHVPCLFEASESIVLHDRQAETHLFRLAQEALNNSAKHGKAKEIKVSLKKADDQSIVLSIQDDGVGLPTDNTARQGLGLRIMNYRTQRMGGTLEIGSAESGGTSIVCTVPLANRQTENDLTTKNR